MTAGVDEWASGNVCCRESDLLKIPPVVAEERNPLLGDVDNIEIPVLIEFRFPDILEFSGALPRSPDGQKVLPVRPILLDSFPVPIRDKDISVFIHIEIDALAEHVILVPFSHADREILLEYESALLFVGRLRGFDVDDDRNLAVLRLALF